MEYRIYSGPLLGDEKDLLPSSQDAGDQVGDRLALTSAWWTLHDEIVALEDAIDRQVLARVCIKDEELLLRLERVRSVRLDSSGVVARSESRPRVRVAGDGRDHVVCRKLS